MNLFFDMDEVLVEFMRGACEANQLNYDYVYSHWPKGEYGMEVGMNMDRTELWHNIEVRGVPFWSLLKPTDELKQLFELRQWADDWFVATKPWNADSAHGKILWMEQYFGRRFKDYYLCGETKEHLAAPGNLLIDDHEKHCHDWIDRGGQAILWPRPWNGASETRQEALARAERMLRHV